MFESGLCKPTTGDIILFHKLKKIFKLGDAMVRLNERGILEYHHIREIPQSFNRTVSSTALYKVVDAMECYRSHHCYFTRGRYIIFVKNKPSMLHLQRARKER